MSGVLCQGKYNCTVIEENKVISYNKLAGIKVEEDGLDNLTKKVKKFLVKNEPRKSKMVCLYRITIFSRIFTKEFWFPREPLLTLSRTEFLKILKPILRSAADSKSFFFQQKVDEYEYYQQCDFRGTLRGHFYHRRRVLYDLG
jgi:hypothetical protein